MPSAITRRTNETSAPAPLVEPVKLIPSGHSTASSLSAHQHAKTASSSRCSEFFAKVFSTIWYYISFQWLCKKKEETPVQKVAEKPPIPKTETKSTQPKEVEKPKTLERKLHKSLSQEEISQAKNEGAKFIAPYLAKDLPPSSEDQAAIAKFLLSITNLKLRFFTFQSLSQAMLKKAEEDFERAKQPLALVKDVAGHSTDALKKPLENVDQAVLTLLRTMRFLCLLSKDTIEGGFTLSNPEEYASKVKMILSPRYHVFFDSHKTFAKVYSSFKEMVSRSEEAYGDRKRLDKADVSAYGPASFGLFHPYNGTQVSQTYELLWEKNKLLELAFMAPGFFIEGGNSSNYVMHRWENFDRYVGRNPDQTTGLASRHARTRD